MEKNVSRLKEISPTSAFGVFICFVGSIWTTISFFSLCDQVGKIDRKYNLNGFVWFIPIYVNIYFKTVNETLNQIIKDKKLKVDEIKNNTALNFLFSCVPMYKMFKTWNEIMYKLEGR